MKSIKYIKGFAVLSASAMLALGSFSCLSDLDRFPTNDVTSEDVYKDYEGYLAVAAKVYGSYALVGHNAPSNSPDVSSADGASADFLRCFYNLQCMTTEEALCTWNDAGIPDLNFMSWSANNTFISGLYYRSIYQICIANEFLRESTPDKVAGRGISGREAEEIAYFRAESRYLRAFQYWVLLDHFGNPPFVDENSPLGSYLPPQKSATELFDWIEAELLGIEEDLRDARTNEYARVDKGALWALLARLYLNAETYTGAKHYTEAITYASKVIGAGYQLHDDYGRLFLADNHLNNPEVILPIAYDGKFTQGYGGLTYIINASFIRQRADVPGVDFHEYFGLAGLSGWYGNRARKELPERFSAADGRYLFFGSKISADNVGEFLEGMAVAKFRNVDMNGNAGSNPNEMFVDTDYPLFRLAEMYLIYAEAVLRGGLGGSSSLAIEYVNKLRERAFGNTSNNFSSLTLEILLEERSRELYWECSRRTDLRRYGLYTSGANLWQWKGGVKEGIEAPSYRNLFPIPASDLIANPNLKQNSGY